MKFTPSTLRETRDVFSADEKADAKIRAMAWLPLRPDRTPVTRENALSEEHMALDVLAALDEIERLKKLLAEAIDELGAAARWIDSTQYRVDDETHKQFATHIKKHADELRKESSDE